MSLAKLAIFWRKWKKFRFSFLVPFGLLLGIVYLYSNYKQSEPYVPVRSETTITSEKKIIGRIGEGYFNFELADDSVERTRGLSGRELLAASDALLFVFDTPGKHCFWMKDMKFAIDILWFDESKKLVYEKRSVSPVTYPESFCPDVPTKYVAEVTAGVADKNQITLGQFLDVEL